MATSEEMAQGIKSFPSDDRSDEKYSEKAVPWSNWGAGKTPLACLARHWITVTLLRFLPLISK